MFSIYHIPTFVHKDGSIGKIGCTAQKPKVRVEEQGYSDYEILEEHTCIDTASEREQQLQKEYGYKVDITPYYKSYYNRLKFGNRFTSEDGKKYGKINGKKNKGKTHTEETKKKMSIAQAGRIFSEEHKQKISKSHIGKIVSEETRKKLSEALMGKKNPYTSKRNVEMNSKKFTCEYCNREIGGWANYKRFHSDNCKYKS